VVFDTVYWTSLGIPDDGCPGVPSEETYNAETNPGGVRCTLADYMINVFGPRPSSVWSDPEKQIGRGFAGMPLDNVGVQYGIEALKNGLITTDQFVDLNEKIGGADIDINPTPDRFAADQPALLNSYKSGAVNSANNLDRVAIIDLRGPDPGAFHDAYRTWAIRARLEREHGTTANHVIWFGAVPLFGDTNCANEALVAMDRWLAAVEVDHAPGTLAQKIIRDRPSDVNDRCSQVEGLELVTLPGIGTVCELKDVQTRYGTPRTVAGEGIETDNNKHAQAVAAHGLLPDLVHRRPVAATAAGVPDRCLRLGRPWREPGGHDPVADVPDRDRCCRLRWPAARSGTVGVRPRLDERRIRVMAQLARLRP
jgi:hypothetical protein